MARSRRRKPAAGTQMTTPQTASTQNMNSHTTTSQDLNAHITNTGQGRVPPSSAQLSMAANTGDSRDQLRPGKAGAKRDPNKRVTRSMTARKPSRASTANKYRVKKRSASASNISGRQAKKARPLSQAEAIGLVSPSMLNSGQSFALGSEHSRLSTVNASFQSQELGKLLQMPGLIINYHQPFYVGSKKIRKKQWKQLQSGYFSGNARNFGDNSLESFRPVQEKVRSAVIYGYTTHDA